MNQELRTYHIERVDGRAAEASTASVTACVGPECGRGPRAVQLTLATPSKTAYGRLTEAQVRDLIGVLETRVDPDGRYEATGSDADVPRTVDAEGEWVGRPRGIPTTCPECDRDVGVDTGVTEFGQCSRCGHQHVGGDDA